MIIGYSRAGGNVLATPVSFSFIGALVTNSANVSSLFTGATDVAGTWNTDTRDTDSIHDTSSNTSRLTMVSALAGRLCVVSASIYVNHTSAPGTSLLLSLRKNNSASVAESSAFSGNNGYNNSNMYCLHTAPFVAVLNDYFEAFAKCSQTGTLQAESTFGVWVLA